jgi:hypothetical protein
LELVQEFVTERLDVRFGDRRLDYRFLLHYKNMQDKLAAL